MSKEYTLEQVLSWKEDGGVHNTHVGSNGFLAPTGEFFGPFPYGTHQKYAEVVYRLYSKHPELGAEWKMQRKLTEDYEHFLSRMGFIFLGSQGEWMEGASHVKLPGVGLYMEGSRDVLVWITAKQEDWFYKHWFEMDQVQQHFIARYSDGYTEDGHKVFPPQEVIDERRDTKQSTESASED